MSKGQHGNIVGRKILFYISIIFPEIPIENEIETYILCQWNDSLSLSLTINSTIMYYMIRIEIGAKYCLEHAGNWKMENCMTFYH